MKSALLAKVKDYIFSNQHGYKPSKSDLNQLKVGDFVVVYHKEESNKFSSSFIFVKIIELNILSFKAVIARETIFEELNIGKVKSFFYENIVKTPSDELNLSVLFYFYNYTVKATKGVLESGNINYLERAKPRSEYETGWRLYEEKDLDVKKKKKFYTVSILTVFEINPQVLPILFEMDNCSFLKDEKGIYVKEKK